MASYYGHKDTAIALAEKGADLNIKDQVSDCYLCVYGDDNDDDDDDDAGVSATLITAICIYVYVYVYGCVCIYVFICMYI